ncbi:hypothetical protein P4O66_016532 [Electrophorus voltai]|uniref:Reverse transcriptase RNase H-like domain-containing protein n=1 Tax=Electrophorus voltai TaxID=2609070 RepID=A0AAD8YV86_9TELE|nr:hypothetical protein P4O66_016532 [Electrophorus voltai]
MEEQLKEQELLEQQKRATQLLEHEWQQELAKMQQGPLSTWGPEPGPGPNLLPRIPPLITLTPSGLFSAGVSMVPQASQRQRVPPPPGEDAREMWQSEEVGIGPKIPQALEKILQLKEIRQEQLITVPTNEEDDETLDADMNSTRMYSDLLASRRDTPTPAKDHTSYHLYCTDNLKTWNSEVEKSFTELKAAFSTTPVFHHKLLVRIWLLEIDASNVGVGVVLSKNKGEARQLKPVAYFSKKLSSGEKNYGVGDRELLAMKLLFEEWRHWLEGAWHPFLVTTDHKNLEYLQTAKRLNSRQAR